MSRKKFSIFSIMLGMLVTMVASDTDRLTTTLKRMETIGQGIEAFYHTNGMLPQAESIDDLAAKLDSSGQDPLPLRDGWGRKFHFITPKHGNGGFGGSREYWLGSSGQGGEFEGFMKYILKTGSSSKNIIYSNGSFVNLAPRN